jgi:hypothetical protein
MDDYLALTFDIFDETGQRASVRPSLTVAELIDHILQEFEGLDPALSEQYGLVLADGERPLEGEKSLHEQGVQAGDRLVFGWAGASGGGQRRSLSLRGARLQERGGQAQFALTWQPALIGRPDADHAHNELLAVDVSWLPQGKRVSRRHAQITEQAGVFYLEALNPQNPTLLNGRPLQHGKPVMLRRGDLIGLGHSGLELRFETI